ncbi:DUF2975 domain-containing protein [Lysobacter auxotrophicus]|uniref:DUF2975 domain-containing protein n=1 Tax=Lysobacter auxotrophicus TaxID=2992573 RepID=A0ABN6UJC6_9GAMM|nr:DUF2975 domain-containing protein [Lysobacter auxotrophicus]BDU16430.1 DUF2975 domain-containing protein [Lysobacter auxotrophicus]
MSMGLARHARVLRIAALAAGAFYVMATFAAMLSLHGWGGRFVAATLEAGDMPTTWAACTAIAIALLIGAAMFELARMLGRVGRERMFSADATRHFRRFALCFLLATLARAAMPAVAMAAQSIPQGALRFRLDGGDLVTLLVAALFWLVARLFDEAARLEDDSRSIV